MTLNFLLTVCFGHQFGLMDLNSLVLFAYLKAQRTALLLAYYPQEH